MEMKHLILGVHVVVALAFLGIAGLGAVSGDSAVAVGIRVGMALMVGGLGVALFRMRDRR